MGERVHSGIFWMILFSQTCCWTFTIGRGSCKSGAPVFFSAQDRISQELFLFPFPCILFSACDRWHLDAKDES